LVVNNKTPTPIFSVSADCEGVEVICFDRVLQVLILRELAVNHNWREIEKSSESGGSGWLFGGYLRTVWVRGPGLMRKGSMDLSTSQVLFTQR
jgi:hypothetical protein